MISIIICSRSPRLLEALTQNVRESIGIPFEIIPIDNAQGKYGICAAYNLGAQQSSYEHLCFMHEDILIHTPDWGKIVVDILTDSTIGLVGVTGSRYIVKAPAPWWGGGFKFCRRNVLESHTGVQERVLQNPENEILADVVAVDGLWFCTRKEVWEKNKFDEKTFPYFHLYDLDFSAQIFQKYRVTVTYQILIEHFSQGSFNRAWLESTLAFTKKWGEKLPMKVETITKAESKFIEGKAYRNFGSRLVSIGYDKAITMHYIAKSWSYSWFNKDNLWLLKKGLKRMLE